MDPLLAKLKSEESRKKSLVAELNRLGQVGPTELDAARLKREMKIRLADTQSLLSAHVSEGRKLLRLLLEGPIQCKAEVDGKESRYVLSGTGNFMNLLPSSAVHSTWCPQRDPTDHGATTQSQPFQGVAFIELQARSSSRAAQPALTHFR